MASTDVRSADAIVVGGGPAGSTCARALVRAGLEVLVLERSAFPRTKLCAGWVTPAALADLELEPDDYPLRLNRFDRLRLHWKRLSVAPPSLQYSIRRYEFDDFLLKRSGAPVIEHAVRDIREAPDHYIIDGEFRCQYLVGAAGTACPVHRALFREHTPRQERLQTATLETEYAFDWKDPDCHLWFFDGGLPGYAWYVPKARGYLNIGIGAMAAQLKEGGTHLRDHWARFIGKLRKLELIDAPAPEPKGYSYYLRGGVDALRRGNAFLIGDSAGLATRDLCEGIGPAIKSGLLAAEAIVGDADYRLDSIATTSGTGWASRYLESRFARAQ